MRLAPLILLAGCIGYPSLALVLQREAGVYKAHLRAMRTRALSQEDLRRSEICDQAVRRVDDLAHAGYPQATPEARIAATTMRDRCAGVEGWGR